MKKFLRRLVITVVSLILLYLIVALFSPSTYEVERSKEMNVSSEFIYEQFSKLENWDNWSPWAEKDSTMEVTIEGVDGTVGAKMKWTGDENISGSGSLEITELIPGEKMAYLLIMDGFMESEGSFIITESEKGATLTWKDAGEIPFIFRPMMLFYDLDAMMGPDFEKGLSNLSGVATLAQEEAENQFEIYETDFPPMTYLGIKIDTLISAIDSAIYSQTYGKLMVALETNQIEMLGMPVSIGYDWNEEDSTCVFMPAAPVARTYSTVPAGFSEQVVDSSKAIVIDYYGEYEGVIAAYLQLDKYLLDNDLEMQFSVEEYVTDPTTVESYDQVLTRIYYILK